MSKRTGPKMIHAAGYEFSIAMYERLKSRSDEMRSGLECELLRLRRRIMDLDVRAPGDPYDGRAWHGYFVDLESSRDDGGFA